MINCAKTVFKTAPGFVASTTPAWPVQSNFASVSGSGGIASAVQAKTYSIAYDSPDFTQPAVPTGPQAANVTDPLNETVAPYSASAVAAISKVTPPAAGSNAYQWGQPINDFLATPVDQRDELSVEGLSDHRIYLLRFLSVL